MELVGFNEQILQSLRPNFFEVLAQEAMHEALRPAFQYLCKVFVHSRPDVLNGVWRFSDELYLVFESLIQLYFIRKYDASFSEDFYSLKRSSCSAHTSKLSAKEKFLSLLCLVFVPYLKVKMDNLFLKLQEEDDAVGITPISYKQLLKLGLKFIFRMRYLFTHSDYYSPLLWLAGVTLSRQQEPEGGQVESDQAQSSKETHWHKILSHVFPLGVFLLKFLEWWYSSERSATVKMMTSLPVPPPPQAIPPSVDGIQLPSNPHLCPLCLNRRREPTTLSSSGYVFCYKCVLGYLREHRKCPITCIPTSEQQMIRLYTQQQS